MSPRNPWPLLICLAGAALRADQLALGSAHGRPGATVLVPVDLVKSSPVVGVQFELRFPPSHVSMAPPVLTNAPNHAVRAETVAPGRQRVVIFSPRHVEMPADLRLRLATVLGAASPQGGPSLALENIIFTDGDGGAVPAGVTYTFLESWRRQHFAQPERDDPAVIGDDRDPDLDGVANLVEAFVAGNPRAPDRARIGRPALVVDGQGRLHLTLRFLRSRDPAVQAELQAAAEASGDLVTWDETGLPLVPTGGGDAQAEELEARIPADTHPHRVLHVFVRRAPRP